MAWINLEGLMLSENRQIDALQTGLEINSLGRGLLLISKVLVLQDEAF